MIALILATKPDPSPGFSESTLVGKLMRVVRSRPSLNLLLQLYHCPSYQTGKPRSTNTAPLEPSLTSLTTELTETSVQRI